MPFRFAVIADTHVNPSDTDQISPYESHRLTNSRLAHTVDVLNVLRPEFVIHVGDMVHPVPEAVSYPDAVARFRSAIQRLDMPLHVVPGNHDVGDKQADYVPAGSIRPEYVALYRDHFGRDFFSFDAGGCHFVIINTSLINSGLAEEATQQAWLEDDLAGQAGTRTFLFVHYPPFIATPGEHGHYDNIDEPGRGWLLALVARHRLTAMFTGHVHNFFFNRHGGTPIFSMPSTAFVRGDYSEMFAVGQPAAHENGRNDVAKLAILLVDVHEDRIVPQFIRTLDGVAESPTQRVQRDWPRLTPAAGPLPTLGIDLRYGWTELHSIPYSSMLDEFRRKQARNDYPVLALWEMGVRKLRVPLDDLVDDDARARMQALAALGATFTVFMFGWPDARQRALIAAHSTMLGALELVLRWPLASGLAQQLADLRVAIGVPLHVSRFWSAAGQSRDGKQIKLLVDHGFSGASDGALDELGQAAGGGVFDAAVFRVAASTPARHGIAEALRGAAKLGCRAQVHVRLASDSPAEARLDPVVNGARVLEAALCSLAWPDADIFIDTLSDVDRGYFPRVGLVDRRFNPNPAGRALRNLNGALSEAGTVDRLQWHATDQVLTGFAATASRSLALVLPTSGDACIASRHLVWQDGLRPVRRLDLFTTQEALAGEPGWDTALTGPTLYELAPD